MATIDLRDGTAPREPGSWLADLVARVTRRDAGATVLRAAIATDMILGGVALAASAIAFGAPTWAALGLIILVWPLALVRVGGYNRRRLLGQPVGWAAITTAAARVLLAFVVLDLVVGLPELRATLAAVVVLAALTSVGRLLLYAWLQGNRRRGRLRSTVLVRGSARDASLFVGRLNRDPARPMDVVAAQITDGAPVGAFDGLTLVPSSTDPVDAAVRNHVSSLLILGPPDISSDVLRRVIWQAESCGVETHILPIVEPVAPPLVAPAGGGVPSVSFQGPNRHLLSLKVVMDRCLAAAGLVMLAPVLAVVAVLVKVTSRGPVLFRQARVGRHGQLFTMLKFRTMCENAEQLKSELEDLNSHSGGTLFKIRHDPRITPVGRVLRRYSLDELPQLINVARGEMSLVGPRPPLPAEVANYPADSMRRFIVRPGLTGLWQVSGRSDLDPMESARLDTQYVENWSLELDLRILARTAKVVVAGSGAY